MIGVEGQYIFKFSIGSKKDFIATNDLERFVIIEECGNVLPTWEIEFSSEDKELLEVFHEGNPLEVSYGVTKDDMVDTKLSISKKVVSRYGDQKYYFIAKGVYYALSYITTPQIQVTDKKSGLEVVKSIAGNHFEMDASKETSSDKQNWIQPNVSDKQFVEEVWKHSWLPNSFVGIGITTDGKFIIRDMKKQMKKDYDFNFSNKAEDGIKYLGNLTIESNGGFLNTWMGYEREKFLYALEKGEVNKEKEKLKTIITDKFLRNSDVKKRSSEHDMLSENVHENYWNAYLRNLGGLALFSTESIELSFLNDLKHIKVLDNVMLKEDEPDSDKEKSSIYQSGKFLVGLVSRSLSSNMFTTTVQLYRESINDAKGKIS